MAENLTESTFWQRLFIKHQILVFPINTHCNRRAYTKKKLLFDLSIKKQISVPLKRADFILEKKRFAYKTCK